MFPGQSPVHTSKDSINKLKLKNILILSVQSMVFIIIKGISLDPKKETRENLLWVDTHL